VFGLGANRLLNQR